MTKQEVRDAMAAGNRVYYFDEPNRVVLTQFGDELVVMHSAGQQFFNEKIHGALCYAVEAPPSAMSAKYQNVITGEWEEYKC